MATEILTDGERTVPAGPGGEDWGTADSLCFLGGNALRMGDPEAALEFGREARRIAPQFPEGYFLSALACEARGESERSVSWCRKVLKIDPDHFETYHLLARLLMPGPSYYDILENVHRYLRPATYLEIGVMDARSLRFALPGTVAVGVDPEPQPAFPLGEHISIIPTTSDDFFASGELARLFGGNKVKLAFIDGMHRFDFALRDFINIEAHSDPETVVVVHDCYPLNDFTSRHERCSRFWTGDVWKLVLILRKYRPDLAVTIIRTSPSGLGFITGLDSGSGLLREKYDRILAEFTDMGYGVLRREKDRKLNAVENSWRVVQELLDGRGAIRPPGAGVSPRMNR